MPEVGRAKRSYEFGPFHINGEERLLIRDKRCIPLAPKLFETLLILVENSGHVTDKDQLMSRLWPDTFVEESSLIQNISQLRKVLGESDSGHRYIETVPKRGYRFIAEVKEISIGNQPVPSKATGNRLNR